MMLDIGVTGVVESVARGVGSRICGAACFVRA